MMGSILGSITGWIYYIFLLLLNARKKRVSLSASMSNILQRHFHSADFTKVRIIPHANGVPWGKSAVTHGNSIFCREGFSEENRDDIDLIVHELVHVEQYNKYGKLGFYILYGFQFLNGGFSYYRIGLEKEAFSYSQRIALANLGDG